MQNEEVIIHGKVKWAHLKRPDKYGAYSIVVYPNSEGVAKCRTLIERGIKNQLKMDEEGSHFIKFKRPLTKTDRQGREFKLEPPVVMNADKTYFDGLIGNGSDCGIKLECYGGTSPKGKYFAARLAEVKIDNLIPYLAEGTLADAPAAKEDW